MAFASEHKEFYITMKNVNNVNVITGIYSEEPKDPVMKYTRMMFKIEDIPYLRITRVASYNDDELTNGKKDIIRYLHSIGQAMDIHPELGSTLSPWLQDAVEKGYFRDKTVDSLRPLVYECLRVVRETTTHMFSKIIKWGASNALIYEKVSSVDLLLDVPSETGFFKEYPVMLWGLVLKGGLEAPNEGGQACITAFSDSRDKLNELDVSRLYKFNNNNKTDYVIIEIVAIGWMGVKKPGYKFYGISNQKGCEGVVYTDNPTKYSDMNYILSANPIKMNVPYEDGTLNA